MTIIGIHYSQFKNKEENLNNNNQKNKIQK